MRIRSLACERVKPSLRCISINALQLSWWRRARVDVGGDADSAAGFAIEKGNSAGGHESWQTHGSISEQC